jgi:alkaline phosphatase
MLRLQLLLKPLRPLRPLRHKQYNVILFVGDGMGAPTLNAARILQGQQKGNSGEQDYLSFETFPHTPW